MRTWRVADLRAFVVEAGTSRESAERPRHWIYDTPIANPMSVYPDDRDSRASWGIDAFGSVLVEAETGDGRVGVGVTTGGEPVCAIVERHLRRFVVGRDPRDLELIWDQMWRATLPDRPGWGVSVDRAAVRLCRPYPES